MFIDIPTHLQRISLNSLAGILAGKQKQPLFVFKQQLLHHCCNSVHIQPSITNQRHQEKKTAPESLKPVKLSLQLPQKPISTFHHINTAPTFTEALSKTCRLWAVAFCTITQAHTDATGGLHAGTVQLSLTGWSGCSIRFSSSVWEHWGLRRKKGGSHSFNFGLYPARLALNPTLRRRNLPRIVKPTVSDSWNTPTPNSNTL